MLFDEHPDRPAPYVTAVEKYIQFGSIRRCMTHIDCMSRIGQACEHAKFLLDCVMGEKPFMGIDNINAL